MRLYGLFDDLPLWALLAITAMIASLSFEGGFRIGTWRSRRHYHGAGGGGSLGGRGDVRAWATFHTRGHVLDRDGPLRRLAGNPCSIRRTRSGRPYLRADLLPEPYRTEIRNFLREVCWKYLIGGRSVGEHQSAIARSEELHDLLWSQAIAAREKASSQILAGYFIQSLNEVISLHTRRMIIREEFRIPDTIWIVVYVIVTLAVLAIGCHAGLTGARRPIVVTAFVLIISVVLTLIADLDSPRRGSLRVSQQALVDVRRTMNDTNQ